MADKSLRHRLKRLFSTNVIVRNIGGSKLKVADTSRMQAFTNRNLYDRYNRVHHAGGSYSTVRGQYTLAYQGARLQLFRDYDIMDNDAIIASALDIYADETTVQSEAGESLIIESPDENVREILHNLFYDILNVEFNLWPWVRNMCKYGDFYLFLEITEDYGIINVMPLSVYDTLRVEGENPQNPYEVSFQTLGTQLGIDKFENYEIAHFRLLSDANWLPYGKAMIEPARRTWKQVQLMEDAMLVHRLVRAPDRRVFKVDIGNLPPSEVDNFMERLMTKVKKTPLIDSQTGDYNLKFNLMNIIEDFYLPVRGGDSGTTIETLNGLSFNATEDVEYLRNKMIGALKIPRAFLGYEEQLSGKATLAAEDVRFARTIERIQRIIISELTKIAIVHLYAQGYTDDQLVNFSLSLTNPSTIYEQEKVALWQEKIQLAQQIQQTNLIGSEWVYEHVFDMSAGEVDDQRIEVVKDKKRAFRLASIEQGQDPAAAAGTQTPGAESMGGEPGGPPAAGGAPDGEAPQGGVDLSGLPVAEEGVDFSDLPELEETGLISDDRGPGRPPEGDRIGTDRHYLGRDPFGAKENKKALHRDPEGRIVVKRRGLSRESLELRSFMKQLREKFPVKDSTDKKIITETSERGSYLDENQLLEENT